MSRFLLLFSLFLLTPSLFAGGKGEEHGSLTVYCYDSFSSEWGPGPAIAEGFKRHSGIAVEFVAPGDAVVVLSRLILEKDRPVADVVVGLDDSLLDRVLEAGILEAHSPAMLEKVPEELIFDPGHRLIPYDHGYFAICYDSDSVGEAPSSLEDLTHPRFADSLALMDPRTSTPGLGFLLWTVAVYGDTWPDYWNRLKPSILTITGGWSQAYVLFTTGEAPLVLSYTTSPVYHLEYENEDRYRAAEFGEGHYRQIEGMGVVAGGSQRESARLFVDFMLSEEAQRSLALSNIMFPVRTGLDLPESFDSALKPRRTVGLPDGALTHDGMKELIQRWTEQFSP